MSTANGLRGGFREAEVLYLAGLNQILHRSRHVFNRHIGIDAVLIKKIDGINVQALQRCVGNLFDVLRVAVQALRAGAPIGVDVEAELGGDDDFVADG
jgi:hypothetical protein